MAKVKITQVRSKNGSTERQKATLRSLKLGKINRSTERDGDDTVVKGMIAAVSHLVKVEKL